MVPFIDDVAHAMARADLVVCRAGASTVAELCVIGRPAVFVPFPSAADDHQRKNAEAIASRDAGVCIEQSKLNEVSLGAVMVELLGDRGKLRAMGDRARALGKPDAAERIARELIEIARR